MIHELEQPLKALEYTCKRPVEHLLAGAYRSVFRGRGIEFEDVRPYQPGDDVRTMDWRVTARTGTPHVKRYQEEREQHFYLLLDVSASMRQANQEVKKTTVAKLCALLSMSAIENQDRVGLILFTTEIEHVIPAAKGRQHLMRILDQVLHYQPQHTKTDLLESFNAFQHIAPKHSVLFILSDFYTNHITQALQQLSVQHDVNALQVTDPPSTQTNVNELVHMEDAETGQQKIIDLSAAQQHAEHFESQLSEQLLAAGVAHAKISAGADCVTELADFFQTKQQQTGNAPPAQ